MTIKNKLIPRIAIASLSNALEVGSERSLDAVTKLAKLFDSTVCEVVNLGVIDSLEKSTIAGEKSLEEHIDVVVFVPVCWVEDYLVVEYIEECPVPVLLCPLPGMETGALCGTQQITCFLKQLQHPYYTIFGDIENNENFASGLKYIKSATLKRYMRRSKIGISGYHVSGMTHTAANEFILKKVIGSRIISFDSNLLQEKYSSFSDSDIFDKWEEIVNSVGKSCVNRKEGKNAIQFYFALKEIIKSLHLDALTIGCYPNLMGKPCLSASLLADEGIPLACEGDINGAVGQLILTLLTEKPTHHTDFLDPTDDDKIIFSHCGSGSFSLAERQNQITLNSVRLMNQGVCATFPAKPGEVTLLSLTPSGNGYQCAILEGEAFSTELVFPGNPVCVGFEKSTKDIIQWISDNGIGHHWMIGYGHVADNIKIWANIIKEKLNIISF